MSGPTRSEHLKKQRDIQQIQEVWQRASVVRQLKKSLQQKLSMVVDEDKIDQVLDTAQKQLQSIRQIGDKF